MTEAPAGSADAPGSPAAPPADEQLAELLRALGHPLRLRMVRVASQTGEAMSATTWRRHLANDDASVGTIAYHVHALFDAGFLLRDVAIPRRGAIEQFYRLTTRGQHLAELVATLDGHNGTAAAAAPGDKPS